jgi:hypothetical protein
MKKINYMRYHRYDNNGTKYIKRFELNNLPSDTSEEGYTRWVRGTGKPSEQALNNVINGVRKACVGVPKTPEQKEKMRQAKLGIPKTEEHKLNMRKSWERRRQILQETHEQTYGKEYSFNA